MPCAYVVSYHGDTRAVDVQRRQEGSVDAARALLDAGADLQALTGGGKTPLHYAVVTWHASPDGAMIKLLLDHGTDRAATAVDGETPAEFADGMWEFPPDLRALLEP